ncbi:hypothetical protein PMZ80_003830 [Knufia obscura]|uniref:Uncharacterized protein n=1 Tax=Knufia obscura TaxID=1635080 RepID=A0ABR0RVC3_9EURO|nr:hypothetical protein PMZ80_003830 [Knufia obscura]
MAEHVAQIEPKDWQKLKKLPDIDLQGPDQEDNGRAYSDIFTQLQIRPESHESFFHSNLKGFRNKDNNLRLLAKGDEKALQMMSQACLKALGKLVWADSRGWLLNADELRSNERPLHYIQPKDYKQGDHDRFFEILKPLWERMRNHIFEVKPATRPTRGHKTPVARSRNNSPTARRPATAAPVQATTARPKTPLQREALPQNQHSHSHHEIAPAAKWSQSEVEEAIEDKRARTVIQRCSSRIWEAQMARLVEYEHYEQQQADTLSPTTHSEPQQNDDTEVQADLTSPEPTDDEDTAMVDAESNIAKDETLKSLNELQADETTPPPHQDLTPNTNDLPRHITHLPTPLTSLPTPYTNPLTSSITPAIPSSLTALITPFSPTPSTTNTQPYLWPSAPTTPTSYPYFLSGIRLRANIPDHIPDSQITLVLAYSWNDSCRVVRNEGDWVNGFMGDLRGAGRKDVVVWRVRVCCVVVGG